MRKVTKKELIKLKEYWERLQDILEDRWNEISALEDEMRIITGFDWEFFMCDGEYCGIGDEGRTVKLINSEELE